MKEIPRLRILREAAGFTLRTLSKRTGISYWTLRMYENGMLVIAPDDVLKLCQHLKIKELLKDLEIADRTFSQYQISVDGKMKNSEINRG